MAGSFMSFQKPSMPQSVRALYWLPNQARPRVQHVGEVAPPRPDGSLKIGSVGPLAEVAFLALVVDRIACFLLDAGVDDGHQPDALLFILDTKPEKSGNSSGLTVKSL